MSKIYVYDYIKSKICLESELSPLSLSMSGLAYNENDTQILNDKIKSVRKSVNISSDNFLISQLI